LVCLPFSGVLLAILGMVGVINAVSLTDSTEIGEGTVAAGYQNFLICVEMFFAAIAMHFAFPHRRYAASNDRSGSRCGTGSSLQSISSNLKEAVNPRDIVADAVYNFHPHYQQYTRHDGDLPKDELEAYYRHTAASSAPGLINAYTTGRYQEQTLVVPPAGGSAFGGDSLGAVVSNTNFVTSWPVGDHPGTIMPGVVPLTPRSSLNEKAVLLPSSSELA
jgi:Organic solute transporter Ostalpha